MSSTASGVSLLPVFCILLYRLHKGVYCKESCSAQVKQDKHLTRIFLVTTAIAFSDATVTASPAAYAVCSCTSALPGGPQITDSLLQ